MLEGLGSTGQLHQPLGGDLPPIYGVFGCVNDWPVAEST